MYEASPTINRKRFWALVYFIVIAILLIAVVGAVKAENISDHGIVRFGNTDGKPSRFQGYGRQLNEELTNAQNPMAAQLESYYVTPGLVESVEVAGNYAYVADGPAGWEIFDVSDPQSPQLVNSVMFSDKPLETIVSGTHAYVSHWLGGLSILDISVPTSPTIVGSYYGPSYGWGLDVVGNYAYMTSYNWGVSIIDVSDPVNPHEVGRWSGATTVKRILATDQYLFVVEDQGSLSTVHILDRSNPISLTQISTFGSELVTGMVMVQDYAYFFSPQGYYVVDISNPYNPRTIGYHQLLATQHAATVGHYIFLATVPGLRILDISEPSNPIEGGQGRIPMPGDLYTCGMFVTATDQFVYITDVNLLIGEYKSYGGLAIFSLKELTNHSYIPLMSRYQ